MCMSVKSNLFEANGVTYSVCYILDTMHIYSRALAWAYPSTGDGSFEATHTKNILFAKGWRVWRLNAYIVFAFIQSINNVFVMFDGLVYSGRRCFPNQSGSESSKSKYNAILFVCDEVLIALSGIYLNIPISESFIHKGWRFWCERECPYIICSDYKLGVFCVYMFRSPNTTVSAKVLQYFLVVFGQWYEGRHTTIGFIQYHSAHLSFACNRRICCANMPESNHNRILLFATNHIYSYNVNRHVTRQASML